MADFRFKDRVALVTGGASGIGEAAVRALVSEGASVVAGDVDPAGLDRLGRDLGERFIGTTCDVTSEADVERLVAVAVTNFGRLDAAFNVAGAGDGGEIHEVDAAVWRKTIDTYLTGTYLSVKHEARAMISRGQGGAIVNVSSICARLPLKEAGAYCCAKAAVEMLTKVSALELGDHGIRVSAVAPGRIETPATDTYDADPTMRAAWIAQIPVGRIGNTQDVSSALLFLASQEASYLSGATLVVDGGFSTTHFKPITDAFPPEPAPGVQE